jgi:hypothetical protein
MDSNSYIVVVLVALWIFFLLLVWLKAAFIFCFDVCVERNHYGGIDSSRVEIRSYQVVEAEVIFSSSVDALGNQTDEINRSEARAEAVKVNSNYSTFLSLVTTNC